MLRFRIIVWAMNSDEVCLMFDGDGTHRMGGMAEHGERHSRAGELMRDVVIGLSDGLTVPFALAAGLSGAVRSTHIVVTAGLAEIAAGSIAMGLGGYLAARGDEDHYACEEAREQREVVERPGDEAEEIYEIFEEYGVSRDAATPVLQALQAKPEAYVRFMMRFELGLERPEKGRAFRSASTIAGSYIVGGLVPLAPYMMLPQDMGLALRWSVVTTMVALALFGVLKARVLGSSVMKGAVQTVAIGGLAAAVAYELARLFNGV
jgi:VIT1/CCC1 family predicted Fe2+/Mn2+ transporter